MTSSQDRAPGAPTCDLVVALRLRPPRRTGRVAGAHAPARCRQEAGGDTCMAVDGAEDAGGPVRAGPLAARPPVRSRGGRRARAGFGGP